MPKKKGRAPSHQNTFAFQHNPKSKLTAKILASPNVGVCRRCRDKIEWRKKYRKYKPLTKPGRCNLCMERNVVIAAYHTICSTCAGSSVALGKIGYGSGSRQKGKAIEGAEGGDRIIGDDCREDGNNDGENHALNDDIDDDSSTLITATKRCINNVSPADSSCESPSPLRACAICVKEPALPDDEGDDEARLETKVRSDTELLERKFGRTLKLRERKALERKVRKLVLGNGDGVKHQGQQKVIGNSEGNDATGAEDDGHNDENEKEKEEQCASSVDSSGAGFKEVLEVDDPFLVAIGGADKLLTGDAYREMLLERQRE